jgi:hypothetical protein
MVLLVLMPEALQAGGASHSRLLVVVATRALFLDLNQIVPSRKVNLQNYCQGGRMWTPPVWSVPKPPIHGVRLVRGTTSDGQTSLSRE